MLVMSFHYDVPEEMSVDELTIMADIFCDTLKAVRKELYVNEKFPLVGQHWRRVRIQREE